jgi:hypothetical protein
MIAELTDDDRERMSFATAISTLETFLADIPLTTKFLKICISCDNRLQRDTLTCALRIWKGHMSSSPSASLRDTAIALLPWLETSSNNQISNPSSSDKDERDININSVSSLASEKIKELSSENERLIRSIDELKTSFEMALESLRNELNEKDFVIEDQSKIIQDYNEKISELSISVNPTVDLSEMRNKDAKIDELNVELASLRAQLQVLSVRNENEKEKKEKEEKEKEEKEKETGKEQEKEKEEKEKEKEKEDEEKEKEEEKVNKIK